MCPKRNESRVLSSLNEKPSETTKPSLSIEKTRATKEQGQRGEVLRSSRVVDYICEAQQPFKKGLKHDRGQVYYPGHTRFPEQNEAKR